MQEYLKDRLWVHLRRAAMTVLASGAVAAATVHADAQPDPACLTGQGSVPLSAFGAFDFISPLVNQAELVRFRQDQDAVLDLPRLRDPQLKTVAGLYPVIDTLTAYELSRIFDVKQVRAELTRLSTTME
jgi:hypothetical protein